MKFVPTVISLPQFKPSVEMNIVSLLVPPSWKNLPLANEKQLRGLTETARELLVQFVPSGERQILKPLLSQPTNKPLPKSSLSIIWAPGGWNQLWASAETQA